MKASFYEGNEQFLKKVRNFKDVFDQFLTFRWLILLYFSLSLSCQHKLSPVNLPKEPYDLHFDDLSKVWDEAVPLGNGMIGALIWENEGKLRFSLDRADLWDLRPMENLEQAEWQYQWVFDQWKKNQYQKVQEKFDQPYDNLPAPSKIPGAALEFDISNLGPVKSVHLYLDKAMCEVEWLSGVRLLTFVHATEPVGWFRFEGLDQPISYDIIPPAYNLPGNSGKENPVDGQDLRRLEYPPGSISKEKNSITYSQDGWGGFNYQVNVRNQNNGKSIEGCWSISSTYPGWEQTPPATQVTEHNLKDGLTPAIISHTNWWDEFWSKSQINVPDTILQKQWYLEMYKFGSAARTETPPISLQAVWTADNGKLPPWKGDFHHDLNTQLSYWPAYSSNHLDLEQGFIDWLWKYRETFKEYTRDFYQTDGLNVPGVTTLDGKPMGGWIQYSFGPTVGAWLGHHFYLHWKYSMDRSFLKNQAYPWIKEVATHFEQLATANSDGKMGLPISSSPEFHDNRREAWYGQTTNFDLSLIRWTFTTAAELALELNKHDEARYWRGELAKWPDLAVDDELGLMVAPSELYEESHRHFSHLMAFHPLGNIDYSNGKKDKLIIDHTISNLEAQGTRLWVGYSFAWMGNLKARTLDGSGAADYLKKFATSFCLPNSFHVNGDQSGNGYTDFTYRPFTLEGNFAFAAGLQEMLLQSHTGIIHIFPAVPENWAEVSFRNLRAEGAFLISAARSEGAVSMVSMFAEKGGVMIIRNPFDRPFETNTVYEIDGDLIEITTKPGDTVKLFIP